MSIIFLINSFKRDGWELNSWEDNWMTTMAALVMCVGIDLGILALIKWVFY